MSAAMTSALTLVWTGSAIAADDTPKPIEIIKEKAAEDGVFKFDYGIPSSPSLKLLGQAEDKVPVVNGLKPLILKLPSLLGGARDGESLGVDIAPTAFVGDRSTRTYNAYVFGSKSYRAFQRLHVGGALYEGVEDADVKKRKRSRATLGLSTSLLDGNDPLMAKLPNQDKSAWQSCLDERADLVQIELNKLSAADGGERGRLETEALSVLQQRIASEKAFDDLAARVKDSPDDSGVLALFKLETEHLAALKKRAAEIGTQLKTVSDEANKAKQTSFAKSEAAKVLPACAKEANTVARYGESLAIGAGALWNGDFGGVDHFESGGQVVWASYRRPLSFGFQRDKGELKPDSYWLVGGSVRASWNELVSTGVTTKPEAEANTLDGWLGVERLTAFSRFALQGGWQRRSVEGGLAGFDRERFRYFVAYSRRITDEKTGLWVQFGYGHVGSGATEDKTLSLSILYAPPDPSNLFGTK